MNQHHSLMDDVDFSDSTEKGSSSAKKTSTTIKRAGLLVLCLAALVSLAYGLGFFGKAAPKVDMKAQAENRQRLEKQVKKEEQIRAKTKAPPVEAGG